MSLTITFGSNLALSTSHFVRKNQGIVCGLYITRSYNIVGNIIDAKYMNKLAESEAIVDSKGI